MAAADFVATGGMDLANLHLARFLARHAPVEIVSHRVEPDLTTHPAITATLVKRPFGMSMFGDAALRRQVMPRASQILAAGGRVVVNGGNCPVPDINWVHYVHAAFAPMTSHALWLRRIKNRYHHACCVRDEQVAFKVARLMIANSHLTARHLIETAAVNPDRIRVVYYGSDPERFSRITASERNSMREKLGWTDRPVIVFIGALGDRRKGFDVLYDAWKRICTEPSWDVDLAVIGRGAEFALWQDRARSDGIAPRIHFLGFRDDVPKVLAACDAMVHPVRYEAYGLGVHEAVCRGLPVLVSRDAGVSERFDGLMDDLLLPNPVTADELADRLKYWRTHLESWPNRMAELSNRFRTHTWDTMSAEIVAAAETVPPR
jgi:glycosyltransferase involved in cell wall biosynthesis